MLDPWVLPTANAAIAAIKNRDAIAKAWDQIASRAPGKQIRIAVVGEAGVGKSVLVDYLLGDAYSRGYKPPSQSSTIERDSRKFDKHRYIFSVVPGQPVHRDRRNDLQDTVGGKNPVDGVIYVVANGYHELRSMMAHDVAAQLKLQDIPSLVKDRRAAEIADFERTLTVLRSAIGNHRRPSWLLLAVNKVDLYSTTGSLNAAQSHYLGDASKFQALMTDFLGRVGSDNFMFANVPVCGWLDHFRFKDLEVKSELTPAQRDVMLVNALSIIERLSKGRN